MKIINNNKNLFVDGIMRWSGNMEQGFKRKKTNKISQNRYSIIPSKHIYDIASMKLIIIDNLFPQMTNIRICFFAKIIKVFPQSAGKLYLDLLAVIVGKFPIVEYAFCGRIVGMQQRTTPIQMIIMDEFLSNSQVILRCLL